MHRTHIHHHVKLMGQNHRFFFFFSFLSHFLPSCLFLPSPLFLVYLSLPPFFFLFLFLSRSILLNVYIRSSLSINPSMETYSFVQLVAIVIDDMNNVEVFVSLNSYNCLFCLQYGHCCAFWFFSEHKKQSHSL